VGVVTVIVFSISAPVDWLAVALLAPTTLLGGYLGATLAARLPAPVLRTCVVVIGLTVAVYLMLD
ncbi:MAG: sulfite exporter TauE/SafE family protein, partial [Actinomycetota bacterium]|nr:sulfite exporter TauE/SafE family protein [Actinomycetota bacterium]